MLFELSSFRETARQYSVRITDDTTDLSTTFEFATLSEAAKQMEAVSHGYTAVLIIETIYAF